MQKKILNSAPGMNLLDHLERTEKRCGYKTAVDDGSCRLTWHGLASLSRQIGSALSRHVSPGSPVPVLMEKSARTLAVMLGAVYAGCFYVPVSPDNPPERIRKILDTLDSPIVVTEDSGSSDFTCPETGGISPKVFTPEMLMQEETNTERLDSIRTGMSGQDLLYGIFTSGSTGTPKAVVVNHEAAIRFIGHFTELFGITEDDRLGNQAPFDFDVSVKDICSAVMTGAQLVLIPKKLFATPPVLIDYLCEKQVTTLTWAVSALTLISSLKGLDYRIPVCVKRVLFSGEAMPPGQLRIWQKALPDAAFVNLYGPTEITCNCTYYPIGREFSDNEKIPAGRPFPGRQVFLLDEDGREIVSPARRGEICVAGESVSCGYYRNPEATARSFVRRTDSSGKEELFYRTGDLAYYNENGELVFAGRKDFQIKHMGRRIELEEIESALNGIDHVEKSCCVFDPDRKRIVGFYLGDAVPADVRKSMKEKLPLYMVPSRIIRTEVMPLNKNGKTDRSYFQRQACL